MNHQPRKRFGQNFLTDTHVIEHIVAAFMPQPGQQIIEIGPGLGALTAQLLPIIKKLQVIELDRDIIPKLREKCETLIDKPDDLTIYNEDVLKFDFNTFDTARPLRIIGNLPYNISTPLIFLLLGHAINIEDMYFMLQKEVVDRMIAKPGNKQYGRLSVMTQYYCEVNKLFDVDASSFTPPPKVQSAFVQLRPYSILPVVAKDEKQLKNIVTLAFSQRRKTLRNSLRDVLDEQSIIELGINPAVRAENLSIEQFVAISNSGCSF